MKAINIVAILFLLLSFQINLGMAQIKELEVGDKIPNQLLKIINNNLEEPKPTIINFWATWCVPCIRELGLLDSVLKGTDSIKVFSITYEDEKTIESFLERNTDLKSGKLTIIPSDTLFKNYFPHRMLPHNIWIGSDGVVQYITGAEDMTKENILSFMNSKEIETGGKIDIIDFDPYEPFHLRDSAFTYRSILTKSIDGIFSGVTVVPEGNFANRKISRAFFFNRSLANILWWVINHGKSSKDFYNTMRIQTSDSLRYFWPSVAPVSFENSSYKTRKEWMVDNAYCYELRFKMPKSDSLFYSYILDDLKRNFNFEIDIIKDSIICSVIRLQDTASKGTEQKGSTYIDLSKKRLVAKNVAVLYLMDYLNENVKEKLTDKPIDPPFIDRTGGATIDVELEFGDNGIPSYPHLKELLKEKYGITIHQQLDSYKVHIIKDLGT